MLLDKQTVLDSMLVLQERVNFSQKLQLILQKCIEKTMARQLMLTSIGAAYCPHNGELIVTNNGSIPELFHDRHDSPRFEIVSLIELDINEFKQNPVIRFKQSVADAMSDIVQQEDANFVALLRYSEHKQTITASTMDEAVGILCKEKIMAILMDPEDAEKYFALNQYQLLTTPHIPRGIVYGFIDYVGRLGQVRTIEAIPVEYPPAKQTIGYVVSEVISMALTDPKNLIEVKVVSE